MRQPKKPELRYEPSHYNYCERCDRVKIYEYDDYGDLDIGDLDLDEEDIIKFPPLEDISLQDLVNYCPEDIKLSDIKISMNVDYNKTNLSFYYDKIIPADMEAYKRDLEEWRKEKKQYSILHNEYEKKLLLFDKQRLERELKNIIDALGKK